MITCPWCGTTYATFQSNCKNCGGPLPAPEVITQASTDFQPQLPPPAPRVISNSYVWKLLWTDAVAITAMILTFIGAIFAMVGIGLTLAVVTAFVGIPFAIIGCGLFLVGGIMAYLRYQEKQKVVNVLRFGQPTLGQITTVEENIMVEVNGRHPWKIEYLFQMNGKSYSGKVSTLNHPGRQFQSGNAVYILCLPENPEVNAIYPHP